MWRILQHNEIMDHWDLLKRVVLESVYLTEPQLDRLCIALTESSAYAIVYQAPSGVLHVVMVATVIIEPIENKKRLLLYTGSLLVKENVPELLDVGFGFICDFAKSLGCTSVCAFTDNKTVLGFARRFNFTFSIFCNKDI